MPWIVKSRSSMFCSGVPDVPEPCKHPMVPVSGHVTIVRDIPAPTMVVLLGTCAVAVSVARLTTPGGNTIMVPGLAAAIARHASIATVQSCPVGV